MTSTNRANVPSEATTFSVPQPVGSNLPVHCAGDEGLLAETHGKWGLARALPGLAALNTGKIGDIAGLVCLPGGNCTAAGGYGIRTKSRFVAAIYVTAEKNGKWGKPERVPGSAALGTDVILETLSCGAPGNCSVSGSYGGKHDDEPFVATEKNGTWGKAERVPGIQP